MFFYCTVNKDDKDDPYIYIYTYIHPIIKMIHCLKITYTL